MKFYGVGTQRKKGLDGEVSFVSVRIPIDSTVRVTAVKEAEQKARRSRAVLEGVYLVVNQRTDRGGILTKNIMKQRASKR